MVKFRNSLLLCIFLLCAVSAVAQSSNQGVNQEVKVGAMSPDFEFADINGKMHSLKDFKGKYVLIDVWATYCAPCKSELPFWEKIQEKLAKKNIVFVSIATDYDKEEWKAFLEKNQLKGVQLVFDRKWISFMHRYQVATIPRYILLDKEGKIINPDMPRPSNPEFLKIITAQKDI